MIARLTPTQRRAALAGGIGLLVFAITQFLLPGSAGSARGTPMAIVFTGLVLGALNGITAVGLVLVYRTSRIINFAQASLGTIGAIFAYNMVVVYHLPYALAFVTAVVISAGLGCVVELLLRRFFTSPRLVVTILTIGVGSVLGTIGLGVASSLPIWGDARDLATTFGGADVIPARSFAFEIGDLAIRFRLGHLLAIVGLVVVLLAIAAFLRYTRLGIAVRASSENTERAELLGINVRILSTVVWTIAGALSGISLTLLGTVESFALGGRGAPGVLIAALAAAIVARMNSMAIAVYASLLISIMQESVRWSFRDQGSVIEACLFVVIALGLLLQRRGMQRTEEASAWEATEEVRPTPRELLSVGGLRRWRWVLVGVAGLLVLAFPFMSTSDVVNRGSLAAIMAIVFLSLVVLTGWAGQLSLGQFGLVAIGALAGGALTSRAGISFWLAVPICAILVAALALVIGLPALRIRGLFLGVVTLAFASAVAQVMFSDRYFGWLQPENIRRPTLLLIDFEDERSMYYLCLAFLVLMVALVLTLRRGRPGRVMIALRESEANLQAFGISVVKTKLAAFALSGFLCGIAGVLYAHHQRAVGQLAFTAQASVTIFVFAVVGGVGSVSGGILGAAFQAAANSLPKDDPILSFFFNEGVGLIALLYIAPGGLTAIAYALRDSILRIIAQRRQIVVPSLFADVDPAVLEQKLIPLGDPLERTGLASLSLKHAYRLDSGLYAEARTTSDQGAPDEREVLGAVAERVGGES